MRKQIQRLLLVFVTVLSTVSGYAYDVEVDGIYYNLDETDRTASVTKEMVVIAILTQKIFPFLLPLHAKASRTP